MLTPALSVWNPVIVNIDLILLKIFHFTPLAPEA
jgi:hypothetical protein